MSGKSLRSRRGCCLKSENCRKKPDTFSQKQTKPTKCPSSFPLLPSVAAFRLLFPFRDLLLNWACGRLDPPDAPRCPRQVVLPNPHHAPALRPQRPPDQSIARLVRRQLLFPERAIVRRHVRVPRTRMPETAVHEHRQPQFPKHEIRLAEDLLVPPPAVDAV
jgi:hypothetical protein